MHRLKTMLAAALEAAPSFAAEIAVTLALVLVTVALWQDFGPRALGLPGAILLWIALPQRPTFIDRAPRAPEEPKGKR